MGLYCDQRHVSRNFLLALNEFVYCEKDLKAAGNLLQEFTVAETGPAGLLNCSHLMVDQFVRKLTRQAFINEKAQSIPEPRGRSRVLLLPGHV